jgi:hypothetical protein
MTKNVRIENACTAGYGLQVSVYEPGAEGQPDVLVQQFDLDYPCQMSGQDLYVTATRYIVVREKALRPSL